MYAQRKLTFVGSMIAGILYKHSHLIPITALQRIIIPLLWTRKLGLKEVSGLGQEPKAWQGRRWTSNPGVPDPKSL